MAAASWIEVDLDRLTGNVAALRALLDRGIGARGCASGSTSPTLIAATVKADAYGMGFVPVVKHLCGLVDWFAVYSPSQALEILPYAGRCSILILMPVDPADLAATPEESLASDERVHFSLHDRESVERFQRLASRTGRTIRLQIYVDTGMSRAGIDPADLRATVERVAEYPLLALSGVYSHFSSSESDAEVTACQTNRFDEALASIDDLRPPGMICHIANSGGVLRSAGTHRDLVRTGLLLWGYAVDAMRDGSLLTNHTVRPMLRWRSTVVHVREVARDATVGYGCTERLGRNSLLGVVPAGYGDGYPLALSSRGVVIFPGHPGVEARVVGRVNMDQLVVDLTGTRVRRGDLVEIYSADPSSPCSLPRLAALCESHCYELLCRLSARLERRYVSFDET